MREEEQAAKRDRDAAAAAAKREAQRQEMLAANAEMLRQKVRLCPMISIGRLYSKVYAKVFVGGGEPILLQCTEQSTLCS